VLKEIPKEKLKKLNRDENSRWFRDDFFDLFLWEDVDGVITGFQLCYDIYYNQRALNWQAENGFSHFSVDDGENRPGKLKATPVLISDGAFNPPEILKIFKERGKEIDAAVFDFVYRKIFDYTD